MNIIPTEFPPANELEILGQQMRKHAQLYPCLQPFDCTDPQYTRFIGEKYNITLTLEFFHSPRRWHGSVCILHDLGLPNEQNFGLPEQGILHVREWKNDDHKNAREILGHLIGPEIIDEKQPIRETAGLFALHWETDARAVFENLH